MDVKQVVQGKALPANRKMRKNPDDHMETSLLAFQLWAPKWQKQRLKVYTDNTTAYSGL